jgi:polyferredoxin
MGLLQDLVYKIKTPKLVVKLKFLRYLKYIMLILFVLVLPLVVVNELSGLGTPWFCKYICPAGTIFGAVPLIAGNDFLHGLLGGQFILKMGIAIAIILLAIPVYRVFCRILCPLGAFYALFNKIALVKMRCDKEKCISCGSCRDICRLRIDPAAEINSPECVRCGDCKGACQEGALETIVLK